MSPLLPVGTGLGASQLSLLLKRQLPSAVGEDRGHFTACDGYDFSWPDAAKVGIVLSKLPLGLKVDSERNRCGSTSDAQIRHKPFWPSI